ncbi:MAG: TIGR02391 family protein [Gammaproteobacteria bacterium]|nr:TIGR02391 family protein [Gammaproteobacteria bacterium]
MAKVPCFPEGQVEALARALGECGSGTDISPVFQNRGLADNSSESTKRRRLYWLFLDCQNRSGCANQVIDVIRAFLTPARFVGRSEAFGAHRQNLNMILAFSGLDYGSDEQFRKVDPATTIDEAERRVRTIRAKFQGRRMHPEVVKYCRSELLQDNYFHAVFEATKGLAQRVRDMTRNPGGRHPSDRSGVAAERPMLAMNTLQTETEKSEHKGFAALLKECIAAVRNPLAHEPKILWEGEDDAADYLSLISLLHRKLDQCVPTRLGEAQ